ncbi:MAG: hypothetical protein K1X88_28310 [Nannocystaceae bacterium]|nr:hypothetical protein [Nannocystaceae bacterium]
MTARHFSLCSTLLALACTTDGGSGNDTSSSTTAATASSDASAASSSAGDGTTTAPGDSSGASGSASATTATSTTDASDGSSSSSSGGTDDPGPDLRMVGPHAVVHEDGELSLPDSGCTMGYDIVRPGDVDDAPTVVLAHGFQGNRGSMAGWAEHWASWGVRVVTPDLCHATIIDADHAQNGADLVVLAQAVAPGPVMYAGYSAGGLAAVLAAAQDGTAIALLGLDMVDSGGLGAAAAAAVVAPAHDVVSEPSMCNSTANGVPVFGAMADSHVVRLFEADHCDFQNPGDALCGLCSSPNDQHTPEQIRAGILGLSTAAVLLRTALDPRAASWWNPGGAWYDAMIEAGELAQL